MRIVEVAGVNLSINEREDWQRASQPIHSSLPFVPGDIEYAVQHWPGAADSWIPPTTDDAVIAHMQGEQEWYLRDKGFSVGYGFEISQTEFPFNIWEVRGFDFRNAANNGDKPPFNADNFNKFSISIQYHASVSHPITDAQILAGRYIILLCDTICGRTLTVQGHQVSDLTSCPGDVIMSKMHELASRPVVIPPPPVEKDFDLKFIAKFEDEFYIGDEVWTKKYGPRIATRIIERYEKVGQPLRNFRTPKIRVNTLEEVGVVLNLKGIGRPVNDVAEEEIP